VEQSRNRLGTLDEGGPHLLRKSLRIPGPRGGWEHARGPGREIPPLRRWQDRLTGRQAPAGAHGELARLPGRHRHPQGKTAHHPRLSEQRSARSDARPRRGVRSEPGALGMVRTGPISNDGPDPQRQNSRPAGARLEACPGSPLRRPGAEPLSHRGPGRSGTARRRVRHPSGARGGPRFRVRGACPSRPTLVCVALDHDPRPPYLAREQGRESDPDRPRAGARRRRPLRPEPPPPRRGVHNRRGAPARDGRPHGPPLRFHLPGPEWTQWGAPPIAGRSQARDLQRPPV